MARKTPVRHSVSGYRRGGGQTVRPYVRGNGQKIANIPRLSTSYLKPKIETEYIGTIGDIKDDPNYKDYKLVTDSQDVEVIWDEFGNDPTVKDFGGFLVEVDDGQYGTILGFPGTIAYNYKAVYKIIRK